MIEIGSQKPLKDAITGMEAGESRAMLEKELVLHEQHLRALSDQCDPLDRAKVQLDIAETLLGLQRTKEAWDLAREIFDVFVQREAWREAIEACEIMYQTDSEFSIAALGQGVWLAVTYPVEPRLTVNMLHHIVDETPDDSDGGPVAAAMAHYIADLRGEGKQREDVLFLSAQVLAQVAKRHRGIEDEEGIKIWLEVLQLDDTNELLPRMAKIIDVMVGENWWIDRDALRARLPVN